MFHSLTSRQMNYIPSTRVRRTCNSIFLHYMVFIFYWIVRSEKEKDGQEGKVEEQNVVIEFKDVCE